MRIEVVADEARRNAASRWKWPRRAGLARRPALSRSMAHQPDTLQRAPAGISGGSDGRGGIALPQRPVGAHDEALQALGPKVLLTFHVGQCRAPGDEHLGRCAACCWWASKKQRPSSHTEPAGKPSGCRAAVIPCRLCSRRSSAPECSGSGKGDRRGGNPGTRRPACGNTSRAVWCGGRARSRRRWLCTWSHTGLHPRPARRRGQTASRPRRSRPVPSPVAAAQSRKQQRLVGQLGHRGLAGGGHPRRRAARCRG